jgi:hypothetical protein
MKRVPLLAALALVGGCVDSDPTTSESVGPDASVEAVPALFDSHVWRGFPATPIFRTTITLPKLPGGAFYKFDTIDLRKNDILDPDPILVVRGNGSAWPIQVANDSCSGGAAACVTIPANFDSYTVTVFARLVYSGGTFDLLVNGMLKANNEPFGGAMLPVSVPRDGMYTVQSVHRPRGATDTQLLIVDRNYNILAIDDNSGVGTAAKLNRAFDGSETVIVGTKTPADMGTDRLVDVYFDSCLDAEVDCPGENGARVDGGDPDNDWLSTALEEELGTNPYKRDTDDDGIFDYYEVIGRKASFEELELPRLGADPRHADLFVEVDRSNDPTTANVMLGDPIMNGLAAIWANLPLTNPDGTTGWRVHADGGTCTDPTLCGMWGGSNVVGIGCDDMPDTATALANLSPARRGIFHYTLRTCGAQGSMSMPISRIGRDNGRDEAEIWSQEIGHNHGLSHSGPDTQPGTEIINNKPNYPSCQNYAYQNHFGPNADSFFSHGFMGELFPENQSEQAYTPGRSKAFLTGRPGSSFAFGVSGDDVDFDGDGRISTEKVMFDPSPFGSHLGTGAPEMFQLADIGTRVPSGGIGVAVQGIQSGGALSKVFVVAPFTHTTGGVFPEITSQTHAVGSPPGSWSTWKPAPALPGGGGAADGEVAAEFLYFGPEPSVFVTMPAADGKLYYSIFKSTSQVWTAWTAMPSWPSGARARQATVVSIASSIWIVFRDQNAADNVANTWITRRDSFGTFDAWQELATPSYLTPGLAQGQDGQQYLLYASKPSSGDIQLKLAARATGVTAFTDVPNVSFENPGLGDTDIPMAERTRLQLLSLPFRKGGGQPFSDGSGYLAAFWNAGRIGSDQGVWSLRRAYTPGRITTSGACFGGTINGGACGASVQARARFQIEKDRPFPGFSPAVAERWHGATAIYVQSAWGGTQPPRPMAYQPWAGGIASGSGARYRDHNDGPTIRANACKTLWALQGLQCRCTGAC